MSEPTAEEEQRNYELEWLEAKTDLAMLRYELANWVKEKSDD